MTCYFRHIQDIFKMAGITVTRENRKEIDQAIHKILGVKYKNCPSTWSRLKAKMKDEEYRKTFYIELKKIIQQSSN